MKLGLWVAIGILLASGTGSADASAPSEADFRPPVPDACAPQRLPWVICETTPVLNSVTPKTVSTGGELVLQGENFISDPNLDNVHIGNQKAMVLEAHANNLRVLVPDNVPAGKAKVVVSVSGASSQELEVTVLTAPKVTGVSLVSGPPGSPLEIYGQNFSANAGQDIVTIGGANAPVQAASTNKLVVVIPEALDAGMPSGPLPVVVEVKGAKSNSDVTMYTSMRYIPRDPDSP